MKLRIKETQIILACTIFCLSSLQAFAFSKNEIEQEFETMKECSTECLCGGTPYECFRYTGHIERICQRVRGEYACWDECTATVPVRVNHCK